MMESHRYDRYIGDTHLYWSLIFTPKYVLLKYNTIDKNIKSIKGGVAGAIPPVKKNDSPSVIKTKQDRLIKYHIDRNAILKDVNGNIMFTYNLDNVITNLKKILRTNNALNPTMSNKSLKELKSTIRESYWFISQSDNIYSCSSLFIILLSFITRLDVYSL